MSAAKCLKIWILPALKIIKIGFNRGVIMWGMLYLMYFLNRKKREYFIYKKSTYISDLEGQSLFNLSLIKCIGQTVTVFIIGGGYGGNGYTGVLMDVKEHYISIYIDYMTLARIPISKIACFSHHNL